MYLSSIAVYIHTDSAATGLLVRVVYTGVVENFSRPPSLVCYGNQCVVSFGLGGVKNLFCTALTDLIFLSIPPVMVP